MSRVLGELEAAVRGRGASSNPTNRFESLDYVPDDDAPPEESCRPKTVFIDDHSKSILSSNESPDVDFGYGLNPYRGCEHGCAYCFARPTHEYLGYSAGLDFETRVMVKRRAPALLREALRKKSWTPQTIGLSGVTDAYQPIERELKLTRGCLKVLAEFRNPVKIVTKNRLVTRDIDLLQELARYQAVFVLLSLTTLRPDLHRSMEPRSSSPAQRLAAIRELNDAGIPVGTLTAPVIPGLNDHELPDLLMAASSAGACYAGYIMLRLPWTVAPLFERWLERNVPLSKDKVLGRIRSVHGGELYNSEYGSRMRGSGPFADQIARIFEVARRKAGLADAPPTLSAKHFRRPPAPGDQLDLV